MANVIKGKLTIATTHSSNPKYNNTICLRLTDENYDLINEVVINPQNFALALTGLASQECEVEIFNERVQRNDG